MTWPSQVGGAYDDSRDHSKHRGATNQGINTSLKYWICHQFKQTWDDMTWHSALVCKYVNTIDKPVQWSAEAEP